MKKITLVLTFTSLIVSAQIIDPVFYKIDQLYKIGDYRKALSSTEEVIKKQNNASAWFRKAMISQQTGNQKEVYSSIDKGLMLSKSLDQKTSAYVQTLADAATAYYEIGNQRLAILSIQKADSIYVVNKLNLPVLSQKIAGLKSAIQFKLGFYNEALAGLNALIPTRGKLIFNDLINPQTNKKLTKNELIVLKEEYARWVILQGQVYFEKGNYQAADSIFSFCHTWIKNNLGSKANERVVNQMYRTRFNMIGGVDYGTAIKQANSAINLNTKTWFDRGKSLKPQSKEMIELKTDLYKYYIGGKDFKTVEKIQNSILNAIGSTYGRNSANFIYYKHKTRAEYYSGRLLIQKAQESLDKLLADTLMLSTQNIKRYEALNMMYQFKLNTGQTSKKTASGVDLSVSLMQKIKLGTFLLGENAPLFQYDKLDLANYYTNVKYNFPEAEKIYSTSLEKILNGQLDKTSMTLPQLYNEMGYFYEITEKYDRSFDTYSKAADMFAESLSDQSNYYADGLEKLAHVQQLNGYYKDAETTIDKCIATFDKMKAPDKELYMNALVTKAEIKYVLSDYDEAKRSLRKSENLSLRLDSYDFNIANEAVDTKAYSYLEQGKYKESEDLLKYSIEDKKATLPDSAIELVKPYLTLGYINFIYGNYPEAEKLYSKALKISQFVLGDNSIKTAECYYKIQKLKYALGDYEKAKETLLKVIEIYKSKFEEKHIFLATAYLDLSNIYVVTNEPIEKSDELLKNALEIVSLYLGQEHPLYAETVKNIAKFYIKTDDIPKAEKYLNISASIFKEKQGRKNLNIAEILVLKGDIGLKTKKLKEAEANYDKALLIYAKSLSSDHPSYVSTQSKLAKVFYLDGNTKKAIDLTDQTTEKYMNYINKYFASLSEREKLKFWNLIKDDFEFYNFLAVNFYKQYPKMISKSFEHSLVTKSVLLNNSLKIKQSILNSGDAALIANYNEYIAQKEQLTLTLGLSEEEKTAQGISVKNIETSIYNLEKELGRKSQFFETNSKSKRYNWLDIKEALEEKETAIEMLRIRHFDGKFTDSVIYMALLVNKNTLNNPDVTVIGDGKHLETKQLKYYRNQIKFKFEDETSYQMFWDPIYAKIPKGNAVYFSPEGVYNQLNIETLLLPDGKYVLDNLDMSISGNLTSLIEGKKKKGPKYSSNLICVLGNPQFYKPEAAAIKQTIQQLPGTEVEATTVSKLFDDAKWEVITTLDTASSEKNIKKYNNPRILHIATHGFFKEIESKDFEIYNEELTSPLNRSGVLLKHAGNIMADSKSLNFNATEGVLTASEAMNLNMDKTELVVLSACETGLGQVQAGEGVYGLQRSFLIAGAGSVVMSLFKVDDEATKLLMVEFYKNWLKTGNLRKSFSDAKRAIKKIKPQPIYWGAFVMIENK